jgi:membrane protein YqaA with SNARE-associated domain
VHFLSKALHFFVLYLIMATYNIGYIVGSSAGYMMGNLVFGLIKDSIVITRVKKEKKEIETKRKQMVEVLQKRKTSMMFVPGGVGR